MNRLRFQNSSRVRLRPWLVVFILSAIYLAAVFLANGSDPRVFVTLGTEFAAGDANGTEGYDGQFVYFIATSPFQNLDRIDVPAYRYQRILLPALARLLALGNSSLIPWTLVAINLIALCGGTLLLECLLVTHNTSRWYALTYGLFAGVFMSVRLSLNEPLAYGLVLAAIWLERNRQLRAAGLVLALAALTKETALLFAGGYVLWLIAERRWKDGLIFAVLSGLPFGLWQFVLYRQFGTMGIGSGGALATPFEVIPFNGFFRIYTDTGAAGVFAVFALLLLPSTILPTLWSLWVSVQDIRRKRWHPYVFLLLVNAGVMPFVPFSTYREPLGILRFIVGLVMMVVLYAALRRRTRALRYSTLWIVLLFLAISSG